ncbi:P-loop containing nucleoside triphosphate hydrolase protein [Coniochaeta sp. 2T2.1]|nr:P-loop containing nucleoside triphosphate hydrolase protein [Coniochaeta sp. 2T2.1]
MADNSLPSSGLLELQSQQRDLIDTIDKLRSLGVGGIVDLPQIIVVGDQSSGKSSVLEAISQLKFPSKDGICTRFATQLSLRRSSSPTVKVYIESTGTEYHDLPPFDDTDFDNDKVAHIIEQAKEVMSAKIGQDGISEDILHIEVSGPNMCPLTLVDLPGFYNSETRDQSANGIAIVERLANRYMAQKSSIILTVVSAKYDMALQTVSNRVLQHDPHGLRTMGIITKADFIRANSHFLSLALNEETRYKYALGWHVLRNRTEDEGDISNEERDANEENLFQTAVWQHFPQNKKGIKALRQRLSKALYEHIKKNMPGLLEEIKSQIKTRQAKLEKLGAARSTHQELRQYLTSISKKFGSLADDAIRGYYTDDFFNVTESQAYHMSAGELERIHKLRALVRDLNCVFYETMVTRGHSRAIIDPENTLVNSAAHRGRTPNPPKALEPWLGNYAAAEPQPVPLEELLNQVDERATINRGTEFPGSINDGLAVREFKEQSSRWKDIASDHIDVVVDVSQSFVESLLSHIVGSDRHSCNAIMTEVVERFFEERRGVLRTKLDELLRHYKYGFPQPLESEFRARMMHLYRTRQLAYMMDDIVGGRSQSSYNSIYVLEKMMICYDMSLKIFTDNIIILAIENCLVCELPNILEPNMVNTLTDEKIKELVSERPEVTEEREQLKKGLAALKEGLLACRRHRPLEGRGMFIPTPFQKCTELTSGLEGYSRLTPEPSRTSDTHLRAPSTPLQHRRNVSSPSSSFSPPSEPVTPDWRVESPVPGRSRNSGSARPSKTETIRRGGHVQVPEVQVAGEEVGEEEEEL